MLFATEIARLRGQIGAVALAGAVAVSLAPTLVHAQAQPQRAPAQRPAAPAAPAAPAQPNAQAAQTGPMVVQLKPEPSQPDWTKVCGKDEASKTEICYTTRDFVTDQGQAVLAVAVYDPKAQPNAKVVRFLVPHGLMLQPGIRFAVDQGQPTAGRYAVCFPNGCFAEATGLKDDVINQMRKGGNLNLSVQNSGMREVTFAIPLAGFGKAFDGAAIDPEVLRKQQEELQKELERKSEELRKRLESSGGTPGAAPAPAAAAPSATTPR